MSSNPSKPLKRPRGLLNSRKAGEDAPEAKRRKQEAEGVEAADPPKRTEITLDDWEDLKELFERALEALEGDDPAQAAALLRGVIHECDRFERNVSNPSDVYSEASEDPPFAFAAISGEALCLMGRLVHLNPEIIIEGEPEKWEQYYGTAHWIIEKARSDVGENPSPWRGRLEIAFALATLGMDPPNSDNTASRKYELSEWYDSAIPYLPTAKPAPDTRRLFNVHRPKLLLDLATEIVDELVPPVESVGLQWRQWVIKILEDEDDQDLRGQLELMRGKCWLFIGSEHAEETAALLEEDEIPWDDEKMQVVRSDLQQALKHLREADTYFKTSEKLAEAESVQKEELDRMIGEALLTLANHTEDEKTREDMYAQAKQYGVDVDVMEEDQDSLDDSGDDADADSAN